MHENVEADLEVSFADDAKKGIFIGDSGSRDVDKHAAGTNRTQMRLSDAPSGVRIERRELYDDIVGSEKLFE